MPPESDDTVRLNPPRAGGRRRVPGWAGWAFGAAALVLAGLGSGAAYYGWRSRPVAPPTAPPTAPLTARIEARPAPAAYAPRLASEAEILADAPGQLEVVRFAPQPAVVVLHFPSLAEQARTLNRAAALIEKKGFPRDRVLADDELEQRIRATGAAPDTFYFGHDYRAADLVRFFALAAESGTALTAEESRLGGLLGALGWRDQAAVGALISLPRLAPHAGLDAAARATILRHELSHGFYFTDPDYAAYSLRFWQQTLTARERALFTSYLAKDGYDPGLPDLMVNEMQAYLMHTADPRFFTAAAVGLTETRLAALRVLFLTGMPPSWLRDCTLAPVAAGGVVPVSAPRRRGQGRGLVRTSKAPAARRALPRPACSRAARNARR